MTKKVRVKDRADGSKCRHEPADETDVPGGRTSDDLGIYFVGRNRELTSVVEQIVQKD